jgi:hypothetical protein
MGLLTLKVFIGLFSDTTFYLLTNLQAITTTLVDNGSYSFSFTRQSNIGFVLAKALTNPNYASGGFLSMNGSTMPWKKALELAEGIIGKSFQVTNISGA